MQYLALTDLPNGIHAGALFDASDDEASVLIQLGAARPASDPEIDDRPRQTYRRRDLKAEVGSR